MSKTLRVDYYENGVISVDDSGEYIWADDFFERYNVESFNGNRPAEVEIEYHGIFSVLRKKAIEDWREGVLGNDK